MNSIYEDGTFVRATKEFTWDMAHMLAGHESLCANVHGHTYRMQVTVAHKTPHNLEPKGPAMGMIVDFKDLKTIIKELIVDKLDHSFMTWENSSDTCEREIARALVKYNKKVAVVSYRPTAENMAVAFKRLIKERLQELKVDYVVVKVSVWETPTSFAEAL